LCPSLEVILYTTYKNSQRVLGTTQLPFGRTLEEEPKYREHLKFENKEAGYIPFDEVKENLNLT